MESVQLIQQIYILPNLSDSTAEQNFRVENPEVKAPVAWTKQLPLQLLTQKSAFMGLRTKQSGFRTHLSIGFRCDWLISVPIIR
jgi:hypothetical protein